MANVISTSLCRAARLGQLSELRRLIDAGHHVNHADNRGHTPLHEAVLGGHSNCVELLLQEDDCNPNAQTHEGFSPLYLACKHRNETSLITLLVTYGADVNLADNEDLTPMHIACSENKLELVQALLYHQADVTRKDFNGSTPLHTAVSSHHLNIIRELLDRGVSPDLGDMFGRSALYLTCEEGWKEGARLLIGRGASVNCSTNDGLTPLMAACQRSFDDVVYLLLQHKANPNLESENHHLALSLAVHNGDARLECLKLILDSGLGPTVCNAGLPMKNTDEDFFSYKCISPLGFLLKDHLLMHKAEKMMDLLLKRGAPVNAVAGGCTMPPVVGLMLSECDPDTSKQYFMQTKLRFFRKLLKNGCDLDYCSLPLRFTGDLLVPDVMLSLCLFTDVEQNDAMLRIVYESSVACNANYIFEWIWFYCRGGYDAVRDILKDYAVPSSSSHEAVICIEESRSVQSLQALSRFVVRRWLWKTLRSSSKAKDLLHALKVPHPVQRYLIGGAWFEMRYGVK